MWCASSARRAAHTSPRLSMYQQRRRASSRLVPQRRASWAAISSPMAAAQQGVTEGVIYRKVKGWKTKGWDSKVLLTVHAHMNKHAVFSPPQLCCRHRSPRLLPSVNNNTSTHLCLPPQLPGTAVSAAAADRQSLAFQPAAPPASPLQCLACHR